MRKIDSDKLNGLLMPGVSKLLQNNDESLGSVYATQVYIKVIQFQGLLIALGENLFHQLVSKFYKQTHILATKYHGVFNIENPNTVSVIFGIKKDGLISPTFHPQKTALFCLEMQEEIERINKWLKTKIHSHYNEIRNHYLRMPFSEREKIDFTDLMLTVATGISTSDLSSGFERHHMRMMNISNETCFKYASYGGVPYTARKLCESGEPNTITSCDTFLRNNNRTFQFVESKAQHINYYGNISAFKLQGKKSTKDLFFINSFFKYSLADEVLCKIEGYINGLTVGAVTFEEVINVSPAIRIGINEYEVFQGSWGRARVNAILTYIVSEMMGVAVEKRYALAIIAACTRI